MDYRLLGTTGLRVSALCMGTMTFGREADRKESAAIFGRWMGYLVVAVAFFGWMTIQSSLWLFGFWSQGPSTPTNLGPRGPDPAWVVDSAGLDSYPSGEYAEQGCPTPSLRVSART